MIILLVVILFIISLGLSCFLSSLMDGEVPPTAACIFICSLGATAVTGGYLGWNIFKVLVKAAV